MLLRDHYDAVVDAVADITKLLQLLPDQNTWNNLKSYCELRYFLMLRLKTGMDEGKKA